MKHKTFMKKHEVKETKRKYGTNQEVQRSVCTTGSLLEELQGQALSHSLNAHKGRMQRDSARQSSASPALIC